MPTTYSTSLRLSLIATGELAGTWGTVTNSNLGTLLEQAITGVVDIVMADANYTLTATNAASDEARNAVLRVTSSIPHTATRQIIIPNVDKVYVVINTTGGSQSIRVQTATPTSYVDIPQGFAALVHCDGSAVVAQATASYNPATNGIFASAVTATTLTAGSVTATITPIAATSGGTGLATYTTGDTLYASAANTLSKLPIGTAGQTLTVAAGIPSWTTVTATGDVVGPASATDNAIARFDLTTGKLIQNSAVTIADTTGDIVGTATQGVFNTVSTTVNAFGAATTLNVGAATGTMTLGNTTLAAKAITASTTLGVTGVTTFGAAVVGAASQDVFNTVSTTVNAFGAATTLNVGAATGTLTVANTTLAAKAITASTTLGVTGAVTASSTLGVTGVATFSNAMNAAQGADVASAGTVNLTTATGNSLHITGTTTITAITLAQGAQRDVTFDGILTLTQGASILLPPGASITTAAGDTASFVGEAAGVVRCTSYTRAAAAALLSGINYQAFTANGTWTKPAGYAAGSRVYVQIWGGGGGGGRGASGTNPCGGGGGGYSERWMLLSDLSATVAVTIGAGGAARTTNGLGNAGSNSTFGAFITGYAGAGGTASAGGGGGGQMSAASTSNCGEPTFFSTSDAGNLFGQGTGSLSSGFTINAQKGVFHGGGGGATSITAAQAAGAASVWGGGGGGGAATAVAGAAGTSLFGGNGGAAVLATTATSGTQPGGGGGATLTGTASGAGGAGQLFVTVFPA